MLIEWLNEEFELRKDFKKNVLTSLTLLMLGKHQKR